jgi:hypothetical protein
LNKYRHDKIRYNNELSRFVIMAMQFWWEDETHTIMRLNIGLATTWDEYHEGLGLLACEATAAQQRVYLIIEIMGNMPPGNPLPHLKQGMAKLTEIPNLGAVMVVGQQRMSVFGQKVIRLLVRLLGPELPPNGGTFNSVDEARAAILKLRGGENMG